MTASRPTLALSVLAGLCAASAAVPTFGQSFPAKPIRIVLPVAAGGNLDLVTRAYAQRMSETLGQQVLVDNRPSAGGILGAEIVARAPADGYTLLSMANTMIASAALRKVGYDPVKDFAGVSLMAWLPQILVLHPSIPVKNVQELVALAKSRPGQLSYGSAGVGGTGHMAMELFRSKTGVNVVHVPYKGNAPALVDVVGGQISMMFDTISTSIPYVKAGRLRALGVTSEQRSHVFPDLPTIAEAGVPGYQSPLINGIVAPANTPPDVLARLHADMAKAAAVPELKARFHDQGVVLTASKSPADFSAFIRSETETINQLVKQAGIKPD